MRLSDSVISQLVEQAVLQLKYNPHWMDEPRDWHGRWTVGGAGSRPPPRPPENLVAGPGGSADLSKIAKQQEDAIATIGKLSGLPYIIAMRAGNLPRPAPGRLGEIGFAAPALPNAETEPKVREYANWLAGKAYWKWQEEKFGIQGLPGPGQSPSVPMFVLDLLGGDALTGRPSSMTRSVNHAISKLESIFRRNPDITIGFVTSVLTHHYMVTEIDRSGVGPGPFWRP